MSDKPFFAMPYPGIFRVTCTVPFPGLKIVHVYITEGPNGGLVVIDSSLGYEDSWARIEQGVRWLDRELTDIETIYLTHAHPDHFGLCRELQEASGAPVVCHPIAREHMLEMAGGPERMRTSFDRYVEHGWAPDDDMMQMPGGRSTMSSMSMGVPERMETIEEGARVTFGGGDWDVYWTPGHEHGHIVFLRASDDVILVGDTLLGRITPHIGWYGEPEDPLGHFMDSLARLEQLAPAFVLPGHGRSFEDGAARARSIRNHHRDRLRRCVESLGRRGPSNALSVTHDVFDRDLMVFEERMAMSEVLSHLEYLRLRGRLVREMHDGTWLYAMPESVIP